MNYAARGFGLLGILLIVVINLHSCNSHLREQPISSVILRRMDGSNQSGVQDYAVVRAPEKLTGGEFHLYEP